MLQTEQITAKQTTPTRTCLVADDHPAVTHVISQLLRDRGFEVLATVEDGTNALDTIERLRPDFAVIDLAMPGLSGIEVARAAAESSPETAVLLYTGHGQETLMKEALDAGVRGLVLKHAPVVEIIRAIEIVASGSVYVDPTLAVSLIAAGKKPARGELTMREREVLRLISDGKNNVEIGKELYISPQTVRTYVRKAMAKLKARNRTHAVATALRRSLII
jgi:DNA-binding NarL/FixJ family response regulator